jgi:malonyl-ACP decarboxylase
LHGTASTEPDADGEARAMRTALRQSGVATDAIRYLNTHGSSSPLGDRVELEAIRLVFGDHFPEIWLNATKALTGHCLNSAGIVELIACVLQMQGGFLHPNRNLDEPIDARARFCGGTAMRQQMRVAMSNSFGFSGINTSIVLRAGD